MSPKLEVCILAAGQGTRMKSDKPKVLHSIAGKPMLAHLLDTVADLKPASIHVVVGHGADDIKAAFADWDINWVLQTEQKGTGHAVMQVMPVVDPTSKLLILLGDAPLVTRGTLERMVESSCELGVLTVDLDNPYNYGRILRGQGANILRIVEERDTSESEQVIKEINTGVMVTDAGHLLGWLDRLTTANRQQEYLLTDIVALAAADGHRVYAIKSPDADEAMGVNNLAQLAKLERIYQKRVAERLMLSGVHLMDPDRLDIRGRIRTGTDVHIDINCILEGDCVIGNGVVIGANCVIRNSSIGDNCEIRPNSVIDGSALGDGCMIGPFARLRPGTHLERDVAIGNFVEVKKSRIGRGSKANHLAYLGDTEIGSGVNIGAGTITCNYDGVDKHVTRIDDNAFVGSNTSLVAPVTIGEGSTIGAGSTITRDVQSGQLVVGRARQVVIDRKRPTKD